MQCSQCMKDRHFFEIHMIRIDPSCPKRPWCEHCLGWDRDPAYLKVLKRLGIR